MKVAALYDVHGMPWALEAVLEEVAADAVDSVVFGGDFVCGPYPRRTFDLVRSVADAVFVRGNCERDPDDAISSELTAHELHWMQGLPVSVVLDEVLYCHSTPEDDMPIVTAATPTETLEELYRGVEQDTVVIGHTHHQFDRRAGDVRIVNAGSIGMPYEGEVAAFWALLDNGEPQFRKTSIDVEQAVAELERSDWPQAQEFAAENVRQAVAREEAIAWFESRGG